MLGGSSGLFCSLSVQHSPEHQLCTNYKQEPSPSHKQAGPHARAEHVRLGLPCELPLAATPESLAHVVARWAENALLQLLFDLLNPIPSTKKS